MTVVVQIWPQNNTVLHACKYYPYPHDESAVSLANTTIDKTNWILQYKCYIVYSTLIICLELFTDGMLIKECTNHQRSFGQFREWISIVNVSISTIFTSFSTIHVPCLFAIPFLSRINKAIQCQQFNNWLDVGMALNKDSFWLRSTMKAFVLF